MYTTEMKAGTYSTLQKKHSNISLWNELFYWQSRAYVGSSTPVCAMDNLYVREQVANTRCDLQKLHTLAFWQQCNVTFLVW